MRALVLLFALATALPPVRLPIDDNGAVSLMVGNPGVHWRFHLNFSLAAIELHVPLTRASQTFSTSSELFYFGDNSVFLPIAFNYAPEHEIYTLKQPVEGMLGLAPGSPLWRHWYNYTYTAHYLQLGEYDAYAQSDAGARPPVLDFASASAMLPTGVEIDLRIDLGRVDTYMPAALYIDPPTEMLLLSDVECSAAYSELLVDAKQCANSEMFSFNSAAEHTVDGLSFNATRPTDSDEIVLGMHFMRGQTLFVDLLNERQFFSPSVFAHPPTLGNAICAVLLSVVMMAWLAVVLVGRYSTPWTVYLSVQLELYGYLLSVLAWLGNVLGDRVDLYLANFVRASPAPYLVFTGVSIVLGLCVSLALLSDLHFPVNLNVDAIHLEYYKNARINAFAGAVFSALWICVVHRHTSSVDALYILFYTSALCLSTTLCALAGVTYSLPGAGPSVLHAVFSYVFFIGSIVPLFDSLGVGSTVAAVLWALVIVLFCSVAMFANYVLNRVAVRQEAQS